MRQLLHLIVFCSLLLTSCGGEQTSNSAATVPAAEKRRDVPVEIPSAMKSVQPFFRPMGKPGKYDWLATFKEPGETFVQYIEAEPNIPTSDRQTIYVLPLGDISSGQLRIIDLTTEFLAAFYDLPVKELARQELPERLSDRDVRVNRYKKTRQIRTGYILDEVLLDQVPGDAAALIALTNDDLFPDATMNYVFGQASLDSRIGVWSLARLDDNASREKFLRRTLKIAAHETGHMFSMRHCTKYECLMSGTNHLAETDRRPLDVCPECMAKICWLSDVSPADRYEKLAEFCTRAGLKVEASEFRRKAVAVRAN